ncbi:MAG: sensor histidine kinase [Pseudonocardiaceae bacterium]
MTLTRLLDYLPRGNLLDDAAWRKRHRILLWVLGLHVPALFVFGLWLGHSPRVTGYGLIPLVVCLLVGVWMPQRSWLTRRRMASFFASAGLVYCSAALVVFSRGSIEAHFHFFIIIGFIALYQDWVPFLWNIVFTVLSHGLGTLWQAGLIFNHPDAQVNPWSWALIHGIAVLFACVGLVIFWRTTEDEQQKSMRLATQLADAELGQRRFTSELLVNLARRNQSMLYRQLDIINQLEEKERDPDALGELFRLDHLATRIRRNAESLLVLSGEEPPRIWREPVALVDVVRAAIAETEDLERVSFSVDERLAVLGHTVTDLTHVLAELTENAVRFSPPEAHVTMRTRRSLQAPGATVLTIEDWGVGMRPDDLAQANELLAHPREVDLSVSQRLGLHVVARLATRHGIAVSLSPTPGSGVTAVVVLPSALFADELLESAPGIPQPRMVPSWSATEVIPARVAPPRGAVRNGHIRADQHWPGWWTPTRPPAADGSNWPGAPVYAATPSPAPAPLPAPSAQRSTGGGSAGGQLNRRVPQANLAPELRRARPAGEVPTTPLRVAEPVQSRTGVTQDDAQRARDALSRYQASRHAALQEQVTAELRSRS